jgi:adenylate cyclase
MSTVEGLVACSDLTGYVKFAAGKSAEDIFQILSEYYEFVGDIITPASGRVIKFMGDAALMFFPADAADAGVRALLALQSSGDVFLSERHVSSRHQIRAHFGSVCMGEIGTRTDKRTDILGSTVNALFLLKASGFAITPEAYRKLTPATRKRFKKQAPPAIYIPTNPSRRD